MKLKENGDLNSSSLIVKILAQSKNSLIPYQISKRSGLTPQLIAYHIPKLERDGLIICKIEENTKKYTTHLCFKKPDQILPLFEPILEKIYHATYQNKQEKKQLTNCFKTFLELYIFENNY